MSDNENTLEDKIFAIAFLAFCFCFGYWTRSGNGITLFFQDLESFILLDGLVRIIAICLGVLVLIGIILVHFEKRGKGE